jgi:hypothetical protein
MKFKILLLSCVVMLLSAPLLAEDIKPVEELAPVAAVEEAPAPVVEEAPVLEEAELPAAAEEAPVEEALVAVEEVEEAPVAEEAPATIEEAPVEEAPVAIVDVKTEETLVDVVDKPIVPAIEEAPAVPAPLPEGDVISQANPEIPTEIKTDADMGEALGLAIDLATHGRWAMAVGLLLMILVYAARRFNLLAMVPKKAIPWITMGLGLTTAIAIALMTENGWSQALFSGLGGAVGSIGLWELAGKHLLGFPKSNDVEESAEEVSEVTETADEPTDTEPS